MVKAKHKFTRLTFKNTHQVNDDTPESSSMVKVVHFYVTLTRIDGKHGHPTVQQGMHAHEVSRSLSFSWPRASTHIPRQGAPNVGCGAFA